MSHAIPAPIVVKLFADPEWPVERYRVITLSPWPTDVVARLPMLPAVGELVYRPSCNAGNRWWLVSRVDVRATDHPLLFDVEVDHAEQIPLVEPGWRI